MKDIQIAILMATYNSSAFIREQLDSIRGQDYIDWKLYIRDDGSRDDTLEIINSYVAIDDRIRIIYDDEIGLGAGKSFMRILECVEADYYFFADHDDVWMGQKLRLSIQRIEKMCQQYPNLPIIVHSDLTVVDANLEVIHNSFWKSSGIKPAFISDKSNIQVFNCVTGCTMCFNNRAKVFAFPYPALAPMHDWWIAIAALRSGGIISHIEQPLIYYRQHGRNEVGARDVDKRYFVKKLTALSDTLKGHKEHLRFLKSIAGINPWRYYFIKIWYTLVRNI